MIKENQAKILIVERFNTFKFKLVDENPEYRKSFDEIISNAYDNGLLWDLLENAINNLNEIIVKKGGVNNLLTKDYYNAISKY